jgi:hypothetical protein
MDAKCFATINIHILFPLSVPAILLPVLDNGLLDIAPPEL